MPGDDSPTVSVVIPYGPKFTPESMLAEARETVAAQSVPTECLVVEDTDHRGPAWARNRGLERADTRYVAFLDADDLWEPEKLTRQLDRMAETGAGICVEGEPMSMDDFVYRVLLGDMAALTPSILLDTEQVSTTFEEGLTRGEDLLFILEAATEAGVCLCPDLYTRRSHDRSVTATELPVTDYVAVDKRFAYLVSQRVPEAQPYVEPYYVQSFTQAGVSCHEAGAYDRAIDYYVRALRLSPHPFTAAYLCRSLVAKYLP
ncbi:glycosyltransferase [Haloarcula sp. GH36]|uniref:glycosyltransferase n=1 Tax=Haloarcula montana TaxID=3111776 RepID=UPI002D7899DE|nr:glycosyltransferase [Haloarcula sp. GH36]